MHRIKRGNMKTLKILIVVLTLLLGMVFAGSVFASETKVSGTASVDVLSNYVWRGQKLTNSWGIQPSVGITYRSFGANIWANYDSDSQVDEGDEHGELSETDSTLSYNFSVEKWNFGLGYIYYALTGFNDPQEVYLSTSYSTLLNPTLTLYYDYDEGNGAFVIAAISHSFEVFKGSSLKLSTSASYHINDKIMGFDENGDV